MDQPQSFEPQHKNRTWLWVILGVIIVGVAVAAFMLMNKSNTPADATNTTGQDNQESAIQDVLHSYYSLLGERKIGDAYQHIAAASGVTQKEYVDYQSNRGAFVNGLNDITYNYIEVSDGIANVSVTIEWSQMDNPITGDTYNQTSQLEMVQEAREWKILWKENEVGTNTNGG